MVQDKEQDVAGLLQPPAHYTPVLPVLFLSGGRHLFQDKFRNRGILKNSTVRITPVRITKCSQTGVS